MTTPDWLVYGATSGRLPATRPKVKVLPVWGGGGERLSAGGALVWQLWRKAGAWPGRADV